MYGVGTCAIPIYQVLVLGDIYSREFVVSVACRLMFYASGSMLWTPPTQVYYVLCVSRMRCLRSEDIRRMRSLSLQNWQNVSIIYLLVGIEPCTY